MKLGGIHDAFNRAAALAGISTVVLAASLAAPAAARQLDFDNAQVAATDLGGGNYFITGLGGNLALSVGEDGVLLIDDEFSRLTEKLKAALAEITDRPIDFVINTHWHLDHTGGNPAMAQDGSLIVAHDNVRTRLENQAPEEWSRDGLPVITFSETTTFHFNGEEIHVFHPGVAHTDGDAVIHFRGSDILHTGDVFWNGFYPRVDLASGGSVDGMIATFERMIAIAGPDTKVIPGHGPLGTRADLEADLAMMRAAKTRIAALIADGLSADEAVAADPLADFNEAGYGDFFITAERMVRTIYEDLAG